MWIPGLIATLVGGAILLGIVFAGISLIDAVVG